MSPGSAAPVGPFNVKVVPLIVAGFIALLKVAVTTVLTQAPLAPSTGATVMTTGEERPAFPPLLSGSLHPVAIISNRKDIEPIVCALYLAIATAILGEYAAGSPPERRIATGITVSQTKIERAATLCL